MNLILNEQSTLVLDREYETATTNNNILYRQYSDKAIAGSVCDLIAPAFPQVVQEFNSIPGGKIVYKLSRKISQKENSSVVSIDYLYNFKFKNIVLSDGDKELKYEDYFFGENLKASSKLDFNLGDNFKFCSATEMITNKEKQIFKIFSSELNFPQQAGTQTIILNTDNYLKFYYLNEASISSEACDLNFSNPKTQIIEDWTSNQGILEIITTVNSTTENPNVPIGFTHKLVLKNATFTNNTNSFKIAEQVLGSYRTNP